MDGHGNSYVVEAAMPDNENVDQSIEVTPITDDDGEVVGTVMDDIRIVSDESGAVMEQIIDVIDNDGNIVAEDLVTAVYDEDGNLVAADETVVLEEE